MEHLDFRGSVITGPFVAKQVTEVRQTVTTVVPSEDKMYVIMRSDFYDSEELANPIGVATSRDSANAFVQTYTLKDARLAAHEQGTDGTWFKHFDHIGTDMIIESTSIYVVSVPKI